MVDALVVYLIQRDEIFEICPSAVSPPHDVMQFGLGEPDTAPGDRTGRVQPAQRPPLRTVRLTGAASLVQLAAGIDDHTVTNDHRERVGSGTQAGEDPFG